MSTTLGAPLTARVKPLGGGRAGRPRTAKIVALSIVPAVFVICALVPGLIAPYDPQQQDILARNLPPMSDAKSGTHLLGTDPLGQDVLSQLIFGARTSLSIAVASVALSGLIGIVIGLFAGMIGGRTESVIMRVVDGALSFPPIVLAIFFLYVAGQTFLNVILVLALLRWVVYARVTRGLVLPYRSAPFIESARLVGCGQLRILFKHVLPNVRRPLMVLATFELAFVMLAEASLSFLGLGVPPPTSSWGESIAEGSQYIATAWWLVLFPGLAIALATITINLVGRSVTREPRVRGVPGE